MLLYISMIQIPSWEKNWETTPHIQKIDKRKYVFDSAVSYINDELLICGFPLLHPRVPFDYLLLSSLAQFPREDPHDIFVNVWKDVIQK